MVSVNSDHEYEPVGGGLLMTRTLTTSDTAPVVRIIDTDIGPVADSDDDGIDIRGRYTPGPILEGDELVLPLDGQIEDRAMDSRELGSGDTSDEIETAQQLQDRIEERFLNSVTPCTESRTDAEINTSQVDSSVMEELPLRRGARGLPNRLRLQADKLRTRLKSIQRPNFNFPIERNKTRKSRSSERTKKTTDKLRNSQKNKKIKKNDKLKTTDTTNNNNNINNEKQSRIQKLRSSIQEHSKFSFPDKSKFHLPERPKINLPNFTKFTNKTNFHMPTLKRHTTTTTTSSSQALPSSNETTAGSRKSIFDFSTVPRFFDKKTKQQQQQHDYTTSSPKDSCADPTESATFPRTKKTKSFSERWTQKFTDLKFTNNDEIKLANEHEKPWIHGSQEKPRLSLRPQESLDDSEQLPWEASDGRRPSQQHEENSYDDDIVEVDNQERMIKQKFKKILRQQSSESYDNDIPQIDPRLYGDQAIRRFDSEETDENNKTNDADDEFRVSFEPVDPRRLKKCISSEEDEEIVNENLHDNLSSEVEDESMRSDREQQASSGSSCDRRRRGVIETIDSDEFFLRAKGISEDEDIHNGEYLNTEIKNALRKPVTAQEVIILDGVPPERPVRMRSFRKRKESYESSEGNNSLNCTKRILRRSEESDFGSNIIQNDDSYSGSRHRVVYHTESVPLNLPNEPLDDLIVIKPIRRKSKLSLRSTSQVPIEIIQEIPSSNLQQQQEQEQQQQQQPPPIIPRRKKHQEIKNTQQQQQQQNVNDNKENIEKEIFGNYTKTEIPIKPARCSSRETINLKNNKINDDNNECVAPIAPSRRSRSRGTSIAQDDDRTSRGAESMSDIAYADDDDDDVNDGDDDEADNKIKIDYPGYALIDKKEKKPPRPPPPQRHRDKFSTAPRLSKHTPSRPERGYSTLKTRTPTPINRGLNTRDVSMSYLDSDDMDDNEQKNLLSGEVLFKMSKRPLPAPPRPPRSRRSINKINHDDDDDDDNNTESIDDNTDDILHDEYAHLSTQTDPLPDDLMIEEITQARLIMTPSEDGSQIFISTERIPSPLSSTTSKIINKNLKKRKKTNSRLSTNSESDIRQSRINYENYDTPNVPPLPFYTDDDNNTPQRPPRTRSHSLSIPKDSANNNNNNNETRAAIIEALEERLSALLANETLRIGSLEVGDLRCDKLNVSQLEAHKIVASEIDAIVITATELTNSGETSNNNNNILNPTVLNELIAIKSQLEQFVLQNHHETTNPISETSTNTIEEVEEKIINKDETKSDKLQLDLLSRSTETRAIYSTHGIQSHQSHHHHLQQQQQQQQPVITEAPQKIEENREKSISRSRSNSPSKTTLRLRQTASPVRSLPPVISVTPDSPDNICQKLETSEIKAQRAKISYTNDTSPNTTRPSSPQSRSSTPQTRPLSTPPPLPPTTGTTIFELPTNNQSSQQQQQQFITFQNSQIPPQFYTLASPNQLNNSKDIQEEPSIICMTQQLLRALQLLGMRAIRHLVHYVTTRLRLDETEAKIREVELAFCALLLIIAGLLIVCFAGPRTITHHHHWDYFNPPRL